MKIAVFDSGLGGLSVLSHLQREFPSFDYYYLGDTARTPYGTRSVSVVERYANECLNFLNQFEPDAIVIACNTVSAVALKALKQKFSVPLFGMIQPVVDFTLSQLKPKRVLLLGTPVTIESQLYNAAFLAGNGSLEIEAVSCPLFVPLVENGLFEGQIVDQVIDLYLNRYNSTTRPDCVILGCTHYPFLKPALQKYFGTTSRLVECAEGVVCALTNQLVQADSSRQGNGSVNFFVTDDIGRFNALSRQVVEHWGGAELITLANS